MAKMAITERPDRLSVRSKQRFSMLVFCAAGLVAAAACGGQYNPTRDIGEIVSPWENLAGVDGKRHGWSEHATVDFLVVVFVIAVLYYFVKKDEP